MRAPVRRRRLVRLHLDGDGRSVEGILIGRSAGHYRLAQAHLLEAPDRSHPIGETWVPAGRVLLVQVLG